MENNKNDKYVVGNMKMMMSSKELAIYLKKINSSIFSNHVILCPTSIYVPYFLKQYYKVGLQNAYFEGSGPYTGEVSPKQAKSLGICCTLVGHSDRRLSFKETDTVVNKKVLGALSEGLSVILCIGETLEEKELLKTDRVLKKQITYALRYVKDLSRIMIAYEPVWAIGTRVVPKKEEISSSISFIKEVLKKEYDYENMKVLYGGSVDGKNIESIASIPNLDGVLVGRASCDAEEFLHIIEVVLGK